MAENVVVRSAREFAEQCHGGDRHPSGLPLVTRFLPAMISVLSDHGYSKRPDVLAAAWLHEVANEATNADDEQARLSFVREKFPDQTYSLVSAMTRDGRFERDRRIGVWRKASSIIGGPALLVSARIIDVLTCTAHNKERLENLAKHHDAVAQYFRTRVDEKLWLLLEQSFPAGMIKTHKTMAFLMASKDF